MDNNLKMEQLKITMIRKSTKEISTKKTDLPNF